MPGVLVITSKQAGVPPYLAPAFVGFLVWGIGLSLGEPIGYAINPARGLGPRIAHQVLPIPGKGSSDRAYGATVPIFGPIVGALRSTRSPNLETIYIVI
jgi:glycerol uptake facilitator protein